MKNVTNLRDLLLEEGRELYDANKQELKTLPKLQRLVLSDSLRSVIGDQLHRTEKEQEYLKSAFKKLNADFHGGESKTIKALFSQSASLLDHSMDQEVRDAGIISALQRLGHWKIAGFGTTATYAREIGHEDAAIYFRHALEEERFMDSELSRVAVSEINRKAVTAVPS